MQGNFWKTSKLKGRESALRIEFLGVADGEAGSLCPERPDRPPRALPKARRVPTPPCLRLHISPVLGEGGHWTSLPLQVEKQLAHLLS